MKITYALFENFLMLDSGLGKRKVELDFSNMPNIINVIVGPMGSGKTTILSHLTPSAFVGTLDERNSDPIIIPNKNGLKKIIFLDGDTEYEINHKYIWTKDHHSVKSYISKNGIELNQNGNQGSFKEIVESELGFGQELLRLIRLGPNVANVIDLSIAERKDYIANMISSVDLYLTIFKDMRERTRILEAQTQLLAKKLASVTDDDISEMKSVISKLHRKIEKSQEAISEYQGMITSIETEVQIYLNGKTVDEYENRMRFLDTSRRSLNDSINRERAMIEQLMVQFGSLNDVTRRLGKCESDINNNNRLIDALNSDYELLDKKRAEMFKTVKAVESDEYIDRLRDEYQAYSQTIEELKEFVEDFECKYTSTEITALMADIQVLESEMNDIIIMDTEIVKTIMNASNDIIASSKKQVEILQAKQIKLQRSLSNIQYINQYNVTDQLFLPKACKMFMDCPYFLTHPNTIKEKNSNSELMKDFKRINEEIDLINSKIESYLSYPMVFSKIQHVKKLFNTVAKKLADIGAIKIRDLKKILTEQDKRFWYDSDKIVDTLELCTKREQLAVCQTRILELKAELDKSISVDSEKIKKEYAQLISDMESNRRTIEEIRLASSTIEEEKQNLTKAYESLLSIDSLKDKLRDHESDLDKNEIELRDMEEKYSIVISYRDKLNDIIAKKNLEKTILESNQNELNSLQIKLSTVENYKKEYGSLVSELYVLDLVKEASSSKKGIPLFYIELFLNECVDDINDMVGIVFDDIEICEFKISDKEFKIPYIKNGTRIDDIRSASQGERAIVSLALSFALMRKGSVKYNIPLLDEIDAPIHAVEREKFLLILSQHFKKINAEQAFIITHNDIFDGYPVNVITTSNEHLDNKYKYVMRLSSPL